MQQTILQNSVSLNTILALTGKVGARVSLDFSCRAPKTQAFPDDELGQTVKYGRPCGQSLCWTWKTRLDDQWYIQAYTPSPTQTINNGAYPRTRGENTSHKNSIPRIPDNFPSTSRLHHLPDWSNIYRDRIGPTINSFTNELTIWNYGRLITKWGGFLPVEYRLKGAMNDSPYLVVGIFWSGWTGEYSNVPWHFPTLCTRRTINSNRRKPGMYSVKSRPTTVSFKPVLAL